MRWRVRPKRQSPRRPTVGNRVRHRDDVAPFRVCSPASHASSWAATLAHDLPSIAYDAAGNLTTLQRYRDTGTLVDNLTYSYTAGTNRLASVSDAVGATAESWDAEAGSFSYDANGNLLTAPAPYNLTT